MRNRFVLLSLLVGVVLCIVVVKVYIDQNFLRNALRSEIGDFISSSIDIDRLSADELRAHYYLTLHTLDPIATLAGADTEKLRAALEELDTNAQNVTSLYQEKISKEVLFPTQYLKKLADTEDARVRLIQNTSPDTAHDYHNTLIDTLAFQQALIDQTLTTLDVEGAPGVQFWQGLSSLSHIREQLMEAKKRIAALEAKETERYDCLTAKAECPPLNRRTETAETEPTYSSSTIPDSTRDIGTFFSEYFKQNNEINRHQGNSLLLDTHYVKLTRPLCSTSESNADFYLLSFQRSEVGEILSSQLSDLNDIYFTETSTDDVRLFGLDPVQNISIPRYVLKLTSYYTCVDYGYDLQTALSMHYVYSYLKEHPNLFSSSDNFKSSFSLQQEIQNAEVLDQETTQHFITSVRDAYRIYGKRYFEEQLGAERTKELLTLTNAWSDRSAHFDVTVLNVSNMVGVKTLFENNEGQPKIGLETLFMVRSNFVSLYQFANHTILQEPLSFLEIPNTEENSFPVLYEGVVSYTRDLTEIFPSAEPLIEAALQGESFKRAVLGY